MQLLLCSLSLLYFSLSDSLSIPIGSHIKEMALTGKRSFLYLSMPLLKDTSPFRLKKKTQQRSLCQPTMCNLWETKEAEYHYQHGEFIWV